LLEMLAGLFIESVEVNEVWNDIDGSVDIKMLEGFLFQLI